jgi:hypothetical protein
VSAFLSQEYLQEEEWQCDGRFDLTLEMTMNAATNEIAGHIEYRTDLFRRSTIENFVKHFEVLSLHYFASAYKARPYILSIP